MELSAVISSAKHPEYGQVTVPLPIPPDEYENLLDRPNSLESGDMLERDCQVDELDYLSQRLEAFYDG